MPSSMAYALAHRRGTHYLENDMTAKITTLKPAIVNQLIGVKLTKTSDERGKEVEDLFAKFGCPVSKNGVDYPQFKLELKSKDPNSQSGYNIGTMTLSDIINTPYEASVVQAKMQHQLRVIINTQNYIVGVELFDFTNPVIQHELRQAYETARKKVAARVPFYATEHKKLRRFTGTFYGSFEWPGGTAVTSRQFRISVKAMKALEQISLEPPVRPVVKFDERKQFELLFE